ncbi:MAG: hypothetical protein GY821_06435 [Gammaproteobacteria bacterium]|nr:hypothetical protein [Gammaproteobacteria bacterium]
MCTLGAAISPDRREDVKDIWQKLISSKHMLTEALEELKKRENQTKKLLGADSPGLFELLDIDEMQEMCKFVPTVFN